MPCLRIPALFVVVLALGLAGCGSDQDPALDSGDSDDSELQTPQTPEAGDGGDGAAGDTSVSAAGETEVFSIELTGAAEVPGPGDDGGSGTAVVTLEPGRGELCYEIDVEDIAGATAAHIHEAPDDAAGPIVVTLDPPTEGSVDACASVDAELLADIAETPEDYYVNVHNEDFPDGALRGQLA